MKSILDEESRKALANYRMQRADESLEEAFDDFVFCDQEMFEDSFPKAKMLIDAIKIMLVS